MSEHSEKFLKARAKNLKKSYARIKAHYQRQRRNEEALSAAEMLEPTPRGDEVQTLADDQGDL